MHLSFNYCILRGSQTLFKVFVHVQKLMGFGLLVWNFADFIGTNTLAVWFREALCRTLKQHSAVLLHSNISCTCEGFEPIHLLTTPCARLAAPTRPVCGKEPPCTSSAVPAAANPADSCVLTRASCICSLIMPLLTSCAIMSIGCAAPKLNFTVCRY